MKIGIFGHSSAIYRTNSAYKTRCQLLAERFPNDQIDWHGAGQCSTERLLSRLQRHKNYDLYILFHVGWQQVYIPGWKHGDLDTGDIRKCARDVDFIKSRVRDGVIKAEDFDLTRIYFEGFVNFWLPSNTELYNRWAGVFTLLNLFCKGKNVIHVGRRMDVIDIKKMIKVGYFSKPLSEAVGQFELHLDKGNLNRPEMELMFANILESEINNYKTSHSLT